MDAEPPIITCIGYHAALFGAVIAFFPGRRSRGVAGHVTAAFFLFGLGTVLCGGAAGAVKNYQQLAMSAAPLVPLVKGFIRGAGGIGLLWLHILVKCLPAPIVCALIRWAFVLWRLAIKRGGLEAESQTSRWYRLTIWESLLTIAAISVWLSELRFFIIYDGF